MCSDPRGMSPLLYLMSKISPNHDSEYFTFHTLPTWFRKSGSMVPHMEQLTFGRCITLPSVRLVWNTSGRLGPVIAHRTSIHRVAEPFSCHFRCSSGGAPGLKLARGAQKAPEAAYPPWSGYRTDRTVRPKQASCSVMWTELALQQEFPKVWRRPEEQSTSTLILHCFQQWIAVQG